MKKQLNEATLEARISNLIKSIFPSLNEMEVKHQKSFSINFGHHEVTVDLKKPSNYPSRAIYDILLSTKDNKHNLILLELKREGLTLKEEDVQQGLSYARLIHPMPPLTLISNGINNCFYNTYTKKKIERTDVDLGFVMELIDNSFKLALNDFKETVEVLIDKNPRIISKIINDVTTNRFEQLKGELSDYTKPICENFIIKREIGNDIRKLNEQNSLIGLIGPALSGKTIILYEFFKEFTRDNNAVLYVDFSDKNYSIFQNLANQFTKGLKYPINKDKVREWIISALYNEDEIQFTFLLDNFSPSLNEQLQSEIIELIDLLSGSIHSIIFTIDLLNYKHLSKDTYRNYTNVFGKNTKLLELKELNLSEFENAQELLFNSSKSFFDAGANFSAEYRQPRLLRLLASIYLKNTNRLIDGQGLKIISVPDYELLKLFANNKLYSAELKKMFEKLSKAYIIDRVESKKVYVELQAALGGISQKSIEEVFKSETEELFKSGFVNKYNFIDKNQTIIYPKLPELIAYYNIKHISEILMKYAKNKKIDDVFKFFEKLCLPFYYSDIIGTGVLLKIAYSGDIDLFSDLVHYLKNIKPKTSKISNGTQAAMLIDERITADIQFQGENFEDGFTGDFFAYSVLSQLAGYPLRKENAKINEEYDFHLQIIYEVASSPQFLGRVPTFSFANRQAYETYDFKEHGKIVCGKNGIIEPIVQSIQKCFYIIPEQIERLYNYAIEEKEFALLWRIYLAIRNEVLCTNDKIAQKAEQFLVKFNKAFPEIFAEISTRDIEDEDFKNRLIEIIKEKR